MPLWFLSNWAGRPGHPRECRSGHRRGLSAVLEVDRIRRYPIRTETTWLEENSRVVFSFVVVHLTTRSEKVSIPRLWRTVANATLAPSTQTGRGGWGWGWGSSNLLAGLGTRGVGFVVAAPDIHPHVLQLLVGHQRHGGALVDQRGRHAPFPIGRVGGVGEVELAEVYVVGHFYPQNLVALCAFVEWSSVSARFYAFSGWPALNPVMAAGGALVSMVAESCAFVAWPQCGCALSASRHDAQRTCLVV